jgi:hypothetical protein
MATGPQLAHGLVAVTVCSLALALRVRVTLRLAVYRRSVRFGAKPLETNDQRFFLQLNSCGHIPYITFFLMRRWVFLSAWPLSSVLISHVVLRFALYTSPLPVQASQSRSSLSHLSYDGPIYVATGRTAQKTSFPAISSTIAGISVAAIRV